MKNKTFEKQIREIKDLPLNNETKDLLVNRENEMKELQTIVDFYESQIIGVCGERGIGKTTLFNLIKFKGKDKCIIRITDREDKISIILNIIYGIYSYARKRGLRDIEQEALRLYETINTRIGVKKQLGVSTSLVILTYSKEKMRNKVQLKNITMELKKIINKLALRTKLVVILDEIDKVRKEELLLIIDALKDTFSYNKITLIVSLPYEIYEEYLLSKEGNMETYNLENVFSYMMTLPRLSDDEIEELILKRINKEFITEDALSLIVYYSDGNPRRAVSVLKEAGMLAVTMGKKEINESSVKLVIKKYINVYSKKLGLSETEWKILKQINEGKRSEVVKKLAKKLRRSKQFIYKYIDKLVNKGMIEEGDIIKLTRRAVLMRELL